MSQRVYLLVPQPPAPNQEELRAYLQTVMEQLTSGDHVIKQELDRLARTDPPLAALALSWIVEIVAECFERGLSPEMAVAEQIRLCEAEKAKMERDRINAQDQQFADYLLNIPEDRLPKA